jgi:hypothetical protein
LFKGYQHRDISIANVLYLENAVEKKLLSEELQDAPAELVEIIDKLGIDKMCHGSIIDGELAIILEDYSTSERSLSRSVCCTLDLNSNLI